MRPPGRPPKDAEPLPITMLTRICEHCGEIYAKPSVESWKRWKNRKYCSPDCYHEARAA